MRVQQCVCVAILVFVFVLCAHDANHESRACVRSLLLPLLLGSPGPRWPGWLGSLRYRKMLGGIVTVDVGFVFSSPRPSPKKCMG